MDKSKEVEVLLVGNELLKGARSDTHLAFVGRVLMGVGARVEGAHVVGDDRGRIAEAVRAAVDRSRVLIVSGGLGPTHDDVTREGVADGLGVQLEFRDDQWKLIEKVFRSFGREADESNKRQAFFPVGATPISNPRGTAAGFMVEHGGCLVGVLPGPPRELIPMMNEKVVPVIGNVFGRQALYTETFRTTAIGESAMTPLVMPIFEKYREFEISSLPHIGGVDVVVTQSGTADESVLEKRARSLETELRSVLGIKIYARGEERLEDVIGRTLIRKKATLAIAESLTGGLIGKRITDVPGSSGYLLADVVAYSNESKVSVLGVRQASLEKHGAVSAEVCREMADGARKLTGARYGLATTGIAGPTGGTKGKPVGLTYYGVAWDKGADVRHRVFPGTRDDIRERVTWAVLFLLLERLSA